MLCEPKITRISALRTVLILVIVEYALWVKDVILYGGWGDAS